MSKCGKTYGKNEFISLDREIITPSKETKYLGVIISSDLSWNSHVNELLNKSIKRMYYLKNICCYLKGNDNAFLFYNSIIKSVLNYATCVWNFGLTSAEGKKLERQQLYAMKILGLYNSYDKDKDSLIEHRSLVCRKKYLKMELDPINVLHKFIRPRLPRTHHLSLPYSKTERTKKSFFYKTPNIINSLLVKKYC